MSPSSLASAASADVAGVRVSLSFSGHRANAYARARACVWWRHRRGGMHNHIRTRRAANARGIDHRYFIHAGERRNFICGVYIYIYVYVLAYSHACERSLHVHVHKHTNTQTHVCGSPI